MQGLVLRYAIREYERRYGVKQITSVEECESRHFNEKTFFDKLFQANISQELRGQILEIWNCRKYLSHETYFYMLAAFVYFIVPLDACPEALLGPLGYTDDVAVLTKCINAVYDDLR